MYAKFNSVKSILLILVLFLFITGCTDQGILELQEEPFENSLSKDLNKSLNEKGEKFHFNTSLSAKNVVWHDNLVLTKAVGEAIVTISKDETSVHFKVNVANIIDVKAAHFHAAMAGYNGGVVATIYSGSPNGRMQGLLAEGYVTSDKLNGMTMEEFIWAIRSGGIYVNVHTSGNPGGEIRGQLNDDSPTIADLTLNLTGLDELGTDFVYEGWIIVDGNPVSTGVFSSVDFPQSFTVDIDDLKAATKFVLSIEPAVDTDPGPAPTKILVGDFVGSKARVSTGIVGDFSNSYGSYILATPTDGANTNENSGIWFLDPTSGSPMPGLDLAVLSDGWKYEGWVVINGIPVSTGTFTNVAATDDFDGFSGPMMLPAPNGGDGFFPGEDFLINAPSGLMFPTDIAGGTAVISVEPYPDNDMTPFTLKPLVGGIPNDAIDHTLYMMGQNLESLPGGSVSR